MDFVGNALKCYEGSFLNNGEQGAKEVEPKLGDCGRNDVCATGYAETDFIDIIRVPAGSWGKFCINKSDLQRIYNLSEEFGNGASVDRCVEPKVQVR